MSFFGSIKNMINRYGNRVTIEKDGKTYSSKAFIQPLHYKSRTSDELCIGGFSDNRYYLYIGMPQIEFSIRENAVITSNGKKYIVHSSDGYELHNSVLYVWAVLKPYKNQRRDDYDTDSE